MNPIEAFKFLEKTAGKEMPLLIKLHNQETTTVKDWQGYVDGDTSTIEVYPIFGAQYPVHVPAGDYYDKHIEFFKHAETGPGAITAIHFTPGTSIGILSFDDEIPVFVNDTRLTVVEEWLKGNALPFAKDGNADKSDAMQELSNWRVAVETLSFFGMPY